MKKMISFILMFALCFMFLLPAAMAENKLALYEEAMKGSWKSVWRYIPATAMALYKTSDELKHVMHFDYPGRTSKAGMTVDTYLTGDETGAVYLVMTTAGDSHGIISFDGGYAGEVSMSADHNTLLVKGFDGSAIIYVRDE
jgi:hypothetical protein